MGLSPWRCAHSSWQLVAVARMEDSSFSDWSSRLKTPSKLATILLNKCSNCTDGGRPLYKMWLSLEASFDIVARRVL
eukprot:8350686-Pyramimonas_sp.AAC.1